MVLLGAVLSVFPWLLPGCPELTSAFDFPRVENKLPRLLGSYTAHLGTARGPSTVWGHLCCSNKGDVGGRAPLSRTPPSPHMSGRNSAVRWPDDQIRAPWLTQFPFRGSNSPHPEFAGGSIKGDQNGRSPRAWGAVQTSC